MTKLNDAVNAAKGLEKQYKGVLSVVEILKEINNLEQAKKDVEAAYLKIDNQFKNREKELNDDEKKLRDIKESLNTLRATASSITSNANTEAAVIIQNAETRVNRIKAEAEQNIATTRKAFAADVKRHDQLMYKMQEEELVQKDKVDKLKKEIESLKKRWE